MPALKSAPHRQLFAGKVNQVGQFIRVPVDLVSVLRAAAVESVLHRDRQCITEGITFAMISAPDKAKIMDGSLRKERDLTEIDHVVAHLGTGSAFGQSEIADVFIPAVFG